MTTKYTLAEIKHSTDRIKALEAWDKGLVLLVLSLCAIILTTLSITHWVAGTDVLIVFTGIIAIICLFLKLEVYLERKKYEAIITIMKKI
jgi:hypothetical protein